MPPFETFRDAESYYATLAHEVTHWTRHPSRLDRDFGRKTWGDEGYAMEELVAELGSAFLSADLDLALEPRADHAAYIESWLKVLKSDKRAIFSAASMRSAPPTISKGNPYPSRLMRTLTVDPLRTNVPAAGVIKITDIHGSTLASSM
jgi:antirestriction protein ArdC